MSQLSARFCVRLLVAVLCSAGTAHAHPIRDGTADPNAALRWNAILLQAIRNTGVAPPIAARSMAIVDTCMFDAWAAYHGQAVGTQLGGSLRRPALERTAANKRKAVSYAAYRALTDLFPTQQMVLFDPEMRNLGYDVLESSSTPARTGIEACEAVLAFRRTDGANQLGDMNGGVPYSDYTGYSPVNSVTVLADPNRWQPLRNPNGSTQMFLVPHWGLVTPFALRSPDQFRPDPPAAAGTYEYAHQARQIVQISATLNDRRKAIALYWSDGPTTETPPGHWNLFGQWVSARDHHTIDQDVVMFFILGNAMLDASIAVWDVKRAYDSIRPVSAIRYLYAGQTIEAWGGPGRGTELIPGEAFRSYIATPPFAEYTSGHSAFSAGGAEVLRRFTGRAFFGATYTMRAGSSIVEPGFAPSADVTLSWRTFQEAADQAGRSRRYGGIHFRDGDVVSRAMGRQIAMVVWTKALTYINGTAGHGRRDR